MKRLLFLFSLFIISICMVIVVLSGCKAFCSHEGDGSGKCTVCGEYFEGTEGLVFQVYKKKGLAYVRDYTGTHTIVNIPETYEECEVVGITTGAFREFSPADVFSIEKVIIPNTVTVIDPYAFSGCIRLKEVVFSKNLKSIGDEAFKDCSSLKSVELLLKTNQNIGERIFENCTSLESVKLSGVDEKVTQYMFSFCTSLTNVELAEGIVAISNNAFYGCTSLEEIKLPKTLREIRDASFYGCESLKALNIPKDVYLIGDSPIACCPSVESIIVEEGNAFYHSKDNCLIETATNKLISGCKNSIIPNYVVTLGSASLSGVASKNIILPNSLTLIENSAFSECENLESLSIPEGVIEIQSGAFINCTSLKYLYIPSTVKRMMYGPFQGCTAIENVEVAQGSTNFRSNGSCLVDLMSGEVILGWGSSCVIPDYALYIGSRAFYQNDKLTSIVIPSRIIEIKSDAFYFCNSLETVIISDGVYTIREGAFNECPALKTVIIPASVTLIERYAFIDVGSPKYYCEVESQPGNWLMYFNPSSVVWGYKVED